MSGEGRAAGESGASDDLRASDADRERLADELREHAVAGRLDTDELEQRVQSAYAARTTGELDALRRDLPRTPAQLAVAHRERRGQLMRRTLQQTGGSLSVFVICTAVWLASGADGAFWPVWVLIVFVISAARNGWRLFGPDADLDAVEARLDDRERQRRRRREERGRRRLER